MSCQASGIPFFTYDGWADAMNQQNDNWNKNPYRLTSVTSGEIHWKWVDDRISQSSPSATYSTDFLSSATCAIWSMWNSVHWLLDAVIRPSHFCWSSVSNLSDTFEIRPANTFRSFACKEKHTWQNFERETQNLSSSSDIFLRYFCYGSCLKN